MGTSGFGTVEKIPSEMEDGCSTALYTAFTVFTVKVLKVKLSPAKV